MVPGSKMQLRQALAELGLSPLATRTSQQVTQYGSLLVVNTDSRSRAHFCVQRNVQLDATGLKRGPVEGHLERLLDDGQSWGAEPAHHGGRQQRTADVRRRGAVLYVLSRGRRAELQYALPTDLPEDLDEVLMPGELRPGFGGPETSELIRNGLDFDGIRGVAVSWLGALPAPKPPSRCGRRWSSAGRNRRRIASASGKPARQR